MIETKRFKLREIEQTDINNIYKGLSDPKVVKYYDVSYASLEATQEQMDWYANIKENETGIWWSIVDKKTECFCGAGGYNGIEKRHQKGEIGFWLLPEYWGKEIMKEVMPLLFKYGFETLGLNRIEVYVQHNNKNCKKALEKLTLHFEGTLREWEIKDGQFIDVDLYSKIRTK